MQTSETPWPTAALRKHMQLELESDAKRNHLLEIQDRIRSVCNDINNAHRDVEHAQNYVDFVERWKQLKST